MSDQDKALFRGAQDRGWRTLVPPQANNPPVAAYPSFLPGAAAGSSLYVVLRSRVAEVVTAFMVGESGVSLPGRLSIQIAEDSSLPLAFQRALPLNLLGQGDVDRSGPARNFDPGADAGAFILDGRWASIPTFNLGQQRVGAVSRTTMQIIRLRRSASPAGVLSLGVPISTIPLHPMDGGPAAKLSTADLVDENRVGVVMRAAHAYAVSKGYVAGLPAFAEGTQALLQIMCIRDAELVEARTVRISGRPLWHCSQLPVGVPHGQIGLNLPLDGTWATVGHLPFATHLILSVSGQLLDYSDFPRPPAYESIDVDTGGIQPAVIDAGGRSRGNLQDDVSAIDDGTTIHVLYYDGFLMHAQRALDGSTGWTTMVADGDGMGDHMSGDVGSTNALVLRQGPAGPEVHAFYTTGDMTLRHAQFDGTMWSTEALDGDITDNDGRVLSRFEGVAAVAEPDGRLQVFYHDFDATNLRHAERRGTSWSFEVLDGSGGADPPPDGAGTGPIRGRVGRNPAAALFDGRLYVFYDDYKNDNIRMAARRQVNGGERWSYRPLDGSSRGHGRITSLVRSSTTAVMDDRLSVLYFDDDKGHLRHAWVGKGGDTPWNFEVVDGAGGQDGRIESRVGDLPAALVVGSTDDGTPSLPLTVAYLDERGAVRWGVLAPPA